MINKIISRIIFSFLFVIAAILYIMIAGLFMLSSSDKNLNQQYRFKSSNPRAA